MRFRCRLLPHYRPREMWGVFYEGSRKPFIITTTLGKALSRLHYRLTHDDWNRYG